MAACTTTTDKAPLTQDTQVIAEEIMANAPLNEFHHSYEGNTEVKIRNTALDQVSHSYKGKDHTKKNKGGKADEETKLTVATNIITKKKGKKAVKRHRQATNKEKKDRLHVTEQGKHTTLKMEDIPITKVPMLSAYKFPFERVNIKTEKLSNFKMTTFWPRSETQIKSKEKLKFTDNSIHLETIAGASESKTAIQMTGAQAPCR